MNLQAVIKRLGLVLVYDCSTVHHHATVFNLCGTVQELLPMVTQYNIIIIRIWNIGCRSSCLW